MPICGRAVTTGQAPLDLERSLSALAYGYRSPRQRWSGNGAILGACDDGQLAASDGRTAVLFNGRIDNRSEIIGTAEAKTLSDAAMVRLAFERWGTAFCDRLVGDFCCAVWDEAARRLILASDPDGRRPLFYWLGQDEIIFASEQRGIWCDPRVPRELDDHQMASWLARLPRDPSRTFYKNICQVPPGHMAIWGEGKLRLERFWRPENIPMLRLAHDQDYADALREVLDEAVRCRIDTDSQIGSTLSSGLDSSSVTALAARHLAKKGRSLTAFTHVPFGPDAGPGEGPGAALVAAMYPNIEHVLIPEDRTSYLDDMERQDFARDWPLLVGTSAPLYFSTLRHASQRGIKRVLEGSMGNSTISYDGFSLLPDLVQKLKWGRLLRVAHQLHGHTDQRWLGIAARAFGPVLPVSLNRALRRWMGRPEPPIYDFTLVRPEYLRAEGVEETVMRMGSNLQNLTGHDGRALRLAALNRGNHRGHDSSKRLFGVEFLDPTSDRRVVELCLSIPDEQFLYRGEPRSLIRRAMGGLLPPEILGARHRFRHADDLTPIIASRARIEEEVARLENSPLAQKCLDMPRMRKMLENWPTSNEMPPDARMLYWFALPFTISAGRFIRRIEGGNG